MTQRLILFSFAFAVGCFQPPGDLCTTNADCPENKQCVTLETRSVCLQTGADRPPAQDGGVTLDGGLAADAGTTTDTGSGSASPGGPVVALGAMHSCAVPPDGDTLKCWGGNDHRQLGLEAEQEGDRFVAVTASGTGALAPHSLAAGTAFTCGAFDRSLWCWGEHPYTLEVADRPWQVETPEHVEIAQLAAGRAHYCALFTDGRVACSGTNNAGQTGQPKTAPNDGSLAFVPDLSNVREIALGGDQSCAVDHSGSLKCWGKRHDHNEALGEDTGELRTLAAFGVVTSLAVGSTHLCALDDQRVARCLGDNTYKQIDLDLRLRRPATELAALGIGIEYQALSASRYGTCALSNNRTVYCWGQIAEGDNRAPELVPNLFDIDHLFNSPQAHHRCAQHEDGTLLCWGKNDRGQLGRGRYEPGGFLEAASPVALLPGGNGGDETPGTSCRQIHEQYPQLPTGRYLVDPEGSGQLVEVHCDMDLEPGGWTLMITVPSQDLDDNNLTLDPPVARYDGSLWGPDYSPVSLPIDFASNIIAYRSPAYSPLSYISLTIGYRHPAAADWRYWSFQDAPRLSLASVIEPGEFVPFGPEGLDQSGDGWCSLIDGACGWGSSGDARGGYNSTWSGTGVRLGFSARQDQPSCGAPVPTYMGVGGSSHGYVAGISRSYTVVACNSNCCNQNTSSLAHGQVWVR